MKKFLLALAALFWTTQAFAETYAIGPSRTVVEGTRSTTLNVTKTGTAAAPSLLTVYLGVPSDTAQAGVDYTSLAVQIPFGVTETTKTVTVNLRADDDEPGPTKRLTAKLVANTGPGTVSASTATIDITDPDIAKQTCWDNSVIYVTETCPDRPLQTCWDKSVIFADLACPVRPLQTCWDKSVIFADLACPVRPTQTCWDNTVIFADLQCPVRPTQTCSDGSVIFADLTCPPPPAPTGHIKGKLAIAGDSQSVFWANTTPGGSWGNTYVYDPVRKDKITFCALAVGGTTIGAIGSTGNQLNNPDRIAALDACNPEVVAFLPSGSNDWYYPRNGGSADTWLLKLWTWTDPLVAKGYKVVVGSVLPAGGMAHKDALGNPDPAWAAESKKFVAEVNPKLAAQAAAHGITYLDLTKYPELMDPTNLANFNADQMHVKACSGLTGTTGHCVVAKAAAPVLDQALGLVAPPPVVTPPVVYTQAQMDARLALVLQTAVKSTNFGNGGEQPVVNEVQGAFRFICGAGQLRYDDPIVYPGQPGKSHLHQFYGNTSANANSTHDSLLMNGDSTCNIGTPTPGNASAYWMPALLDGKGHVIQPDYVQVYYKREPSKYPQSILDKKLALPSTTAPQWKDPQTNCEKMVALGMKCTGIPDKIRFISGMNMETMQSPNNSGEYLCGSVSSKAAVDGMELLTNATCQPGTYLEIRIQGERCHNGQLDSADHRSHVAKALRDATTNYITACDKNHPNYMPAFTLGAFYLIKAGDDVTLWHLSSDMPGMKRGETLHFDYHEAWWPAVKAMWEGPGGCIELYLNCSAGFLGSGKGLIGADNGTVKIEAAKFDHRPLIPVNPNGVTAQ